jgi:putative membrane protein
MTGAPSKSNRESRAPGRGGFDEAADATRRTQLANERTYLAWWRTGLTAFAVAIGSGKLIPAVASGTTWPYTVIGIGFALAGVFCSVYAYRRERDLRAAITRGDFVHPDERVVGLMAAFGALLGALLIVALLAGS